jgi:hypothetical protein
MWREELLNYSEDVCLQFWPDCQNSVPPEWPFLLGSDYYLPHLYQFIIIRPYTLCVSDSNVK